MENRNLQLLEEGTAFLKLNPSLPRERVDVVVIGGGQAGLSVGYHLAKRGVQFVILDASPRVGDSWRQRWDSLRLFSPARYDGLDGMPFPARPDTFPTKDEFADYLERYAAHFKLPVQSGVRVQRLHRERERYIIETRDRIYEADRVVIAMASYQRRRIPAFARELEPSITQLHSADYRSPAQLQPGAVLIAGAGNSGAEIAAELSPRHPVLVAGRSTGQMPFRIDSWLGRNVLCRIVLRLAFHYVLTIRTRIGRKLRPIMLRGGGPLIRTRLSDLRVERGPRVVGVKDGKPMLEDGRVLDVSNVVWSTGFMPGSDWIDLPIFDDEDKLRHEAGIVPGAEGLFFVGLHFLYSMSSSMIHGVGRDAARIADAVADARTTQSESREAVAAAATA